MKLMIKINGPKVHDVGYRPFLTELAMKMGLRGFEVFNDEENDQTVIIALLEGDDGRVKQFFKFVTIERPPLALVDNVTSIEYTGEVMPMWQAASINTAVQMNKAIPLLLEIKKNTDVIQQVAANTGSILDEARGLREDIQPGFAVQFRQIQADVKAIKERLGMT
jgi:acylphosphatase